MATDRSSHGWTPAERAPQLRRTADWLEQQAKNTEFPDRARRLAREMRMRATAIELGAYAEDDYEASLQQFRAASKPPVVPHRAIA